MPEYIERDEAMELLSQPITMSMCLSVDECHNKREQQQIDRYLIENIPAADVVERKRGEWKRRPDPYGWFETIPVCSICGCTTKWRETYMFCPNCGADMIEDYLDEKGV